MGRILQILSHQMIRYNDANIPVTDDHLTSTQRHVLHHILLETLHHDIYQKNIEEEFEIRKSTATGILQLMEKNGYIYRESVERDGRLKRIVPTHKAEALRENLVEYIRQTDRMMMAGVSEEEEKICRKVLFQMYRNLAEKNTDNKEVHSKDE